MLMVNWMKVKKSYKVLNEKSLEINIAIDT